MSDIKCSACHMFKATIGSRCESCDGVIRHFLEPKIMNNTNSPNGQGGFPSGSFREASRKLDYGNFENDGSGFTTGLMLKKMLETIKENTKPIHFLDTPEGKDWFKIDEWRKSQKANKTNK